MAVTKQPRACASANAKHVFYSQSQRSYASITLEHPRVQPTLHFGCTDFHSDIQFSGSIQIDSVSNRG